MLMAARFCTFSFRLRLVSRSLDYCQLHRRGFAVAERVVDRVDTAESRSCRSWNSRENGLLVEYWKASIGDDELRRKILAQLGRNASAVDIRIAFFQRELRKLETMEEKRAFLQKHHFSSLDIESVLEMPSVSIDRHYQSAFSRLHLPWTAADNSLLVEYAESTDKQRRREISMTMGRSEVAIMGRLIRLRNLQSLDGVRFENQSYRDRLLKYFVESPCPRSRDGSAWTREETQKLYDFVTQAREQNRQISWAQIAFKLGTRSLQACCSKWNRGLDPELKTGKFDSFESQQLRYLVGKHGKKWSRIAAEIPGRSDVQCRAHYMR
eukprot:Partr_v1_DN24040_c0_g1_i1_m34583 putative Small nuclear RNA activating complex, polypeptide 4, 190kDa